MSSKKVEDRNKSSVELEPSSAAVLDSFEDKSTLVESSNMIETVTNQVATNIIPNGTTNHNVPLSINHFISSSDSQRTHNQALLPLSDPFVSVQTKQSLCSKAAATTSDTSSSDSDSEGDDVNYSMGYLPLPQEAEPDDIDNPGINDPDIDELLLQNDTEFFSSIGRRRQRHAVSVDSCLVDSMESSSLTTSGGSGGRQALQEDCDSNDGDGDEIEGPEITADTKAALDDGNVDTIKQVMLGFCLPSSSVPDWAKQVPEDVWKAELIEGLQNKKHKHKRRKK